MITSPTVLVLGAGASIPYGFPSGEDLGLKVLQSFSDVSIRELVGRAPGHYGTDRIHSFVEGFRNSGLRSVDAFLEQRPEFVKVGKLIMADLLIRFENPKALNEFTRLDTWYHLLWKRMVTSDLRSFRDNQLSIITLNYDRSIEEFLYRALLAVTGEHPEKCAKVMKSIPIIHVHGQLGFLPWQADDYPSREYTNQLEPESLAVAAKGIRIVTENIEDSAIFERARELVHKAKNAYLIGFGFLKENIRRLGLQVPPMYGDAIRKATCYGLEAAEKAEADNLLEKGNWHLVDTSLKADLFLRREVLWHLEGQRPRGVAVATEPPQVTE